MLLYIKDIRPLIHLAYFLITFYLILPSDYGGKKISTSPRLWRDALNYLRLFNDCKWVNSALS